jgi:predicted nucleic acid-binding protein
MAVADTELLFALNPLDRKHARALRYLERHRVLVPDVALFEFQIVLRARGRSAAKVASAMMALKQIFIKYNMKEVNTINTELFIRQAEIEERFSLSYFDSLVAAAALSLGDALISDDAAFDRVPGIERVPLAEDAER